MLWRPLQPPQHHQSRSCRSPTSLREAEGIAGASNLARAAVAASALAERQRERNQPTAAEPQVVPEGDTDMDISVFYENTMPITNNDEVGSFTPNDNHTPNGYPTPSPRSPPTTPNLHPCQPPLFVSYTNCRHDYTRSDERIIYDSSSPDTPSRFIGEWCSLFCHVPKRCLRHFPFTHGCPTCMPSPLSSNSDLDYHPNLNGTPNFIRVGDNYPEDVRPKYTNCETGMLAEIQCDYSFETMPVTPSILTCRDESPYQPPASAFSPTAVMGSGLETNRRATRLRVHSVSFCATKPPIIDGCGQNFGETFSFLTQYAPLFQDASSIVAMDDPVDTWALAQISNRNTDTRFLRASYAERKRMMERNMWPLDTPHFRDPPTSTSHY